MQSSVPLVTGRFVIPSVVTSHFHLRFGDHVADLGAGSGYFTECLAAAVGDTGHVYACEIQRDLIQKIGDLARRKGLANVHPLWCDLEEQNGVKIADDSLDAVIMVNTLFQLEDKTSAFSEVDRILKSGGKFFVIDWTESFSGLGPQPVQVCPEASARSLAESANFSFERSFDAGDHHYGIALKK